MLVAILLAAAPVTIASKDDLLDFRYRWSTEAAAVPGLDRRFRADAAKEKAQALQTATANRGIRQKMGTATPGGDFFFRNWTTAGQSPRLLSLEGETSIHTGGAHPNSGTTALLWDRRLGTPIGLDAILFRAGWWNAALTRPFCVLLDRERRKRRGEMVRRSDPFGDCPALHELTVTLVDKDRNGRFDHARMTADAYVAGPYAEGEYVISLPLTAAMIYRLKPEYRPSFEAQSPVQ
ncbi:hypothetical protein ACFQPG_08625 [Sphingomonas sp. GCM10030256]|uniref:hypothetical protein n=1 Tax=Sphingomonas sp. GCM10030256 TaxID=3273427 RepID=UPI00361D8736